MSENWYYKELKQKLEKFKKLRGSVSSEQKEILEETIATIENLCSKRPFPKSATNQDALLSDYYSLIEYQDIWWICKCLKNYINDDFIKLPNPDLKIKDKEVLELTYDFFKKVTPPDIFAKFLQLFKQRKNIHFVHSKSPIFYADAVFLNFDKSIYIQMDRKNEFADIPTLCHEFGHGIQFVTNYDSTLFSSLFCFSEIISMFFELLCGEYYAQENLLDKQAIATNFVNFDLFCESSLLLVQEMAFLKPVLEAKITSKSELYRKIDLLAKNCDKEELNCLLDNEPVSDFPYIIGYIISIELFLIYKKDPDKAFYILRKLMEISLKLPPNLYLEKIIDLEIMPGENIKEYDEHLKRELKRLYLSFKMAF